jgi:protein ImuA
MTDPLPDPDPDPGPDSTLDRTALLEGLRARIRRLEGIGGAGGRVLPFGVPVLDAALPDGGLPLCCLHEVAAGDAVGGAATGFAAALLAAAARAMGAAAPAIWITRSHDLYAPGLAPYGLTPDRLVLVRADRPVDVLWALEEVLRCPGVGAVLAEVGSGAGALDLAASRRLQLAAESGGVTGLLLRLGGAPERRPASAAVTRWQVDPAPSLPETDRLGAAEPGIGAVRWKLRLLRCRGGRPGSWLAGWQGGAWTAIEDRLAPDAEPVPASGRTVMRGSQ